MVQGLQFKEHQIYCHGDDVRFIDWKLYARTNTPYIKTFEEERNVEIIIFIDLSLSMLMGHRGIDKASGSNQYCMLNFIYWQEKLTIVFNLCYWEMRRKYLA